MSDQTPLPERARTLRAPKPGLFVREFFANLVADEMNLRAILDEAELTEDELYAVSELYAARKSSAHGAYQRAAERLGIPAYALSRRMKSVTRKVMPRLLEHVKRAQLTPALAPRPIPEDFVPSGKANAYRHRYHLQEQALLTAYRADPSYENRKALVDAFRPLITNALKVYEMEGQKQAVAFAEAAVWRAVEAYIERAEDPPTALSVHVYSALFPRNLGGGSIVTKEPKMPGKQDGEQFTRVAAESRSDEAIVRLVCNKKATEFAVAVTTFNTLYDKWNPWERTPVSEEDAFHLFDEKLMEHGLTEDQDDLENEQKGMLDSELPTITPGLKQLFRYEETNARSGGADPATLGSAMESLVQWPVEDFDAAFGETPQWMQENLSTLTGMHGPDTPLSRFESAE